MSDQPPFTPPRPAMPVTAQPNPMDIPSRAAPPLQPGQPVLPSGEPVPPAAPAHEGPGRVYAPPRTRNANRPARGRGEKAANTKARNAKRLHAAEIKKLNAKRQKAKAAKSMANLSPQRAADQAYRNNPPPKNPNRPLEAKTRLHAVLTITRDLKRPELAIFTDFMQKLDDIARGARRRILDALGQVYPS